MPSCAERARGLGNPPFRFLVLCVALVATLEAVDAPRGRDTVPVEPSPLIVVSGNEKGFIRPCGCSKPKLGGIHRRATAIAKLRAVTPDATLVSTGNLIVSGDPQQKTKLEHFVLAMSGMGYAALAVGPGELRLPIATLLEFRDLGGFPFVCANLERDGASVFRDRVVLAKDAIVFSGILPDALAVEGAKVTPSLAAVRRLVAELTTEQRLLLFWGGTKDDLALLVPALDEGVRPRVILLVSGDDALPAPPRSDGLRSLALASKGRVLHLIRPDRPDWYEDLVLREELAEDDEMNLILDGYRERVGAEHSAATVPKRPNAIAYLGDAACIECHDDVCRLLDATPHERAFASLVATNDHQDPECVACHVTGWAVSQGFVSDTQTPKLLNVQCEACHGPGRKHVEEGDTTPNGALTRKFCLTCHDPDNSPQFDFERYWPIIAHPPK